MQAAKESYPDLEEAADRYAEKGRISHWLLWNELWLEEGSAEARAGCDRVRATAMEHRRDLVLPVDWRPFLTLYLLRFAPGLAPAVRKAWMTLRHPGPLQKNAIRYGLMTLFNYLLSFLIVFVAARALAAEALGGASFASSVVSYFALIAQMGIPLYGMRLCAKSRGDPAKLSQSVAELFAMGALLTGASLVLFALTVLFVPQLSAIAPLMVIFGVGLLAQCINFEWAFKGLEEYRYLLVRSVAVKTLAFVLVLLLVHSQADLYRYAAITVFSAVGCSLVDFVRLSRFVSPRQVGRLNLRPHIRPVMTFFLMSCATLIYANLDIVMLGFMRDAAEVGYYEIAVKAKVALTAIGGILWNVTLPRATALWAEGDRDGFERLAQRTLRFVCVFQAVVTVVFMLCAGWVIPFIAGDGYLPAVPAFRILLLTLLPIGVSNIIGGQVLIPAGAEKRLLVAELCGAGLNLVLNFALIPVWGIEGAASATVAAEVVVALVAYYWAAKDLHVVLFPWERAVARALGGLRASAVAARCRVAALFIPDDRVECYCTCCEMPLRAWGVARFAERPDLYDARRYAGMPQDVVCPACGSIPRHRIIAWYLGRHLELVRGRDVLHFAAERGLSRWFGRHGVRVTTADLRAPADLQLDLCDIALPDGSWDVIVCNHVLEHVADWRRALAELRRVLRPGGLLVCSFPIDPRLETVYEDAGVVTPEGRVAWFGQHDHLRVFGADSAELLRDAGFRVEVVRGSDCPDVIRPVVGPADYDSDEVFFCWKQG